MEFPPLVLSKYTIDKEIGRGGQGSVYLATDKRTQRQVAIKKIIIKTLEIN